MNINKVIFSILAGTVLVSCSDNTSSLGSSIVPAEDILNVHDNTVYATSRSIQSERQLLDRGSDCYIGRYTDSQTGIYTEADFLTQVNCTEGFAFPDSVYGLEQFHFSEDVKKQMEGKVPFSADLKLYFSEYIGSSDNTLKIEVWPLSKTLNPNERYYSDINPEEYYDVDGKPLATATVSPVDYIVNDSLRSKNGYMTNLFFSLPDSIAYNMLRTFYSEGGPSKFADAPSFIENICKGFYLRCVQGDGSIFKIYQLKLEVKFWHLTTVEDSDTLRLTQSVAEFLGNSEVMQISRFRNTGLESLLEDDSQTYIRTPYCILTELTLPVDEVADNSSYIINSASMTLQALNNPDGKQSLEKPSTLLLIRKGKLKQFFEKASVADNINSYHTTLNTQYNEYSFSNISRMIMQCDLDRAEWMKEHGLDPLNSSDRETYQAQFPDWNKALLIPVNAVSDGGSGIIYFTPDQTLKSTILKGGKNSDGIPIKIVKTDFTIN